MHLPTIALLLPVIGGVTAVPTTPARSSSLRYALKERHAIPNGWTVMAPAAKSHMINLQIGLKQSNQDIIEQHVYEVSDPSHHRYGEHLSASEVSDLIAPSRETVDLVHAWLQEHNITEVTRSPSNDWVAVMLPVEKVEQLLETTYLVFKHEDGSTLVRAPEWSLPENLHEHIDVIQPTTSFFRPSKHATDFVPPEAGQSWHDMAWWKGHHYPKPHVGDGRSLLRPVLAITAGE